MTTMTHPRRAAAPRLTLETTQVWGALLSSYSAAIGGISVWSTEDGALRYAERVLAARPGIEFELMTYLGEGPWRSVAGGHEIPDVIARRWS
ncbi:hypothetical protein [Arthrobacter terrae]|nr:hypothetical protein [Arthrobacter terrae]